MSRPSTSENTDRDFTGVCQPLPNQPLPNLLQVDREADDDCFSPNVDSRLLRLRVSSQSHGGRPQDDPASLTAQSENSGDPDRQYEHNHAVVSFPSVSEDPQNRDEPKSTEELMADSILLREIRLLRVLSAPWLWIARLRGWGRTVVVFLLRLLILVDLEIVARAKLHIQTDRISTKPHLPMMLSIRAALILFCGTTGVSSLLDLQSIIVVFESFLKVLSESFRRSVMRDVVATLKILTWFWLVSFILIFSSSFGYTIAYSQDVRDADCVLSRAIFISDCHSPWPLLRISRTIRWFLVVPIFFSVTFLWIWWCVTSPIIISKVVIEYVAIWDTALKSKERENSDRVSTGDLSDRIGNVRKLDLIHSRAAMKVWRSKEDNIVVCLQNWHVVLGWRINVVLLLLVSMEFVAFFCFLLTFRDKHFTEYYTADMRSHIVSETGVGIFIWLWIIWSLLHRSAHVYESFRQARVEVFRGMRSWELSTALSGEATALYHHMESLENVFAIRLLGLPVTNTLVHGVISTIVVGAMFTLVVPLVAQTQ